MAPPSSLRRFVCEGLPSTEATIPLTDTQILGLLEGLPADPAGQRWKYALRLIAAYGLRSVELLHLQLRPDGQVWCNYQKRSGGGTTKPRPLRALHPEWEEVWELTVSRQCELLGLSRSTLYYKPVPVNKSTLRIMARIDALYLEDPTTGSRRLVHYLDREGIPISRDHVRNLMQRMGLRAIDQRPRTIIPGSPSERFPCLVDLQQLKAPDEVWATEITYIPLR